MKLFLCQAPVPPQISHQLQTLPLRSTLGVGGVGGAFVYKITLPVNGCKFLCGLTSIFMHLTRQGPKHYMVSSADYIEIPNYN